MTPSGIRCASITRVLSSPSATSVCCIDARSSCEYDLTAATRSEMRRVDSFTSASRLAVDRVLATHSKPGSSVRRPSSTSDARSHQAMSTPAAASGGAISQSCSTPWRDSQVDRASSRSAMAIGSVVPGCGSSS